MEKKIVEVKEFSYLGYVLQKNGGQAAQIKDKMRPFSSGGGIGAGTGDQEKKIREKLRKKAVTIRQIDGNKMGVKI